MSQPYPPYGQPPPYPQGYGQPYQQGYGQQGYGGQYPGQQQPPAPGFAMPPPHQGAYGYQDPNVGYNSGSHNVTVSANETDVNHWAGFTDKNIRRMFVQKVYSILSIQLFITFGLTAIVVLTPSIKSWVRQNTWLYWVSYVVFFSLYITLMCCKGPRRNYPTNFILLTLFTIALSFMVAMLCSFHNLTSVLIAAGITAVCCTAVTVFSFWTKFDFTKLGGALAIASLGLFIMGICMLFIKAKILLIVYAGIGTVLFMLFLAYDTQLITGGKKYELSPEEYIMASIMLYVDIVYIFLMVLQLVSAGRCIFRTKMTENQQYMKAPAEPPLFVPLSGQPFQTQPLVEPYGYTGQAVPPAPGFNYTQPPQAPPVYTQSAQQYPAGGDPMGGSYNIEVTTNETDVNHWAGFTDKNIRRMFVQKVYSILSLQLFITFGLTAIVVLTPSIKHWVQHNLWIYIFAYCFFFVLYITLICCPGPRRTYPTNFILLFLFTISLSIMVAMISAFHDLFSVLTAAGITAVCCTAVSLFSCYTKFDFTRLWWVLSIASLGLIIMAILMLIMRTKILLILYAGIGTVVFMLFLAYDTQMILGGKKYELSAEEYILGSLLLYLDIVNIFLLILRLVGGGGKG
ncbi:protein lifeguard 1-like [Oppia nitens]|uniref:protein lifeguard 1-like n=1 Tax=Oppia nitens TaxID=1686743 RepID=UPI0023DC1B5E|nr:protein lifeguard 1-like [Oppia nitens]